MLGWTRAEWEAQKTIAIADALTATINAIILTLYKLGEDSEHVLIVDRAKLKRYGLWNANVKWGDLGVVEVRCLGNRWEVIVEEAASLKLEDFLSEQLERVGWNNVWVRTQW